MLFFLFRAQQLKWPSNFFYWFTCNPSACCALSYKWLMFKCVGLHKKFFISFIEARVRGWIATGWLCNSAKKVPRPQSRHAHVVVMKLERQSPETELKQSSLRFFWKIFHDLSQRKSTWRAQWMKWKKKEIFGFFFVIVIADIFCEISILHAMYIKHKLSDSCSLARFYYNINISNVYAFIYALPQL